MSLSFSPFTPEQKSNIKDLFGKQLLKQIEEMKTTLIAIADRKSQSETQSVKPRSTPNVSSASLSEKKEEPNEADVFENLLNDLQFTPFIKTAVALQDSQNQLNDILDKAEKFKDKLKLKGVSPHVEAAAHLIFKTIEVPVLYCASIAIGAFLISASASFIAPALVPIAMVIGGVLGSKFADQMAKQLNITSHSFFSPAHRRAIESANIENTIKEGLIRKGFKFAKSR